ncbi:replication initiator [Kribbella soli]|uniref:Replication initiation protein n=1 Tax=Kribbella soli TaxID=1124743 RepID=A0A4R0HMT7_9ACTN|nr:replication initiator [Kribbella soli]TCC11274.1 replication initiation protein [Kribbella soli]
MISTLGQVAPDVLHDLAVRNGVCVRPVLSRLTDTATGEQLVIPIPCGSTQERQCPPCADRARKLRMQQCREGWHRDDEVPAASDDDADEDTGSEDETPSDVEESARRVRSTRRRQDAPDLPRVPMDNRTVGTTFTAPDGRTYRPSMFLTLTLPSYGKVGPDGTPLDPGSYDYHRAAMDALHFPKLVDRFWQNLRRCAGYKVQYFATVEAQRRLAPHLHAAVRGVIPRQVVKDVVAATYHQLWWPQCTEPAYTGDDLPRWDDYAGAFLDPHTGTPLPTWEQALDSIGDDLAATPAHVVKLGTQLDYQGIIADADDKVGKAIGYLTKYLAKSIADTYGDDDTITTAQAMHLDRLHREVRWLPCSPTCSNWLRYGVQPKDAEAGMRPGWCPSKAHDRHHLGLGGRRVLVSRQWTGKTLTDHKADRAEVVRQTLAMAGVDMPDTDRYATTTQLEDGMPRFIWTPVDRNNDDDLPTWHGVLTRGINERIRWRTQYEQAKQRANGPPADARSATDTDDAANSAA